MTGSGASQAVKQFILERYLAGEDPSHLTNTTPLVSGGILDSLALLDLVAFIEQQYGVQFEAHEVDPTNFDTLDAIDTLVQRKLGK